MRVQDESSILIDPPGRERMQTCTYVSVAQPKEFVSWRLICASVLQWCVLTVSVFILCTQWGKATKYQY